MLDLLSKHPSILHAKDIADICSPLHKLNITYFAHVRISHDKKLSAISSNPVFAMHYLKNKFYLADIHMLADNRFGDFFVWDGIEFRGDAARMCQQAGEMGLYYPFTIIERNSQSIDYYHFASNTTNRQINQTYIANLDLLKLFISYFKTNVTQSKMLSKAYQFTFDVNAAPNTSFEDDAIIYERSDFIQCIQSAKKHDRLQIDNVLLSLRQSEILRQVVLGKTMKEISRVMNLSPRTVGHYFNTIKNKLNISRRSELVSKAMELDSVKFFVTSKDAHSA